MYFCSTFLTPSPSPCTCDIPTSFSFQRVSQSPSRPQYSHSQCSVPNTHPQQSKIKGIRSKEYFYTHLVYQNNPAQTKNQEKIVKKVRCK